MVSTDWIYHKERSFASNYLVFFGSFISVPVSIPKTNWQYYIAIAEEQLAKLGMEDFYYDLLDKFINRTNIELIQIGSNILYIALSV